MHLRLRRQLSTYGIILVQKPCWVKYCSKRLLLPAPTPSDTGGNGGLWAKKAESLSVPLGARGIVMSASSGPEEVANTCCQTGERMNERILIRVNLFN